MATDRNRLNEIIEKHYGFIVRTVSETTGRYVSVQNDDCLSIGLQAFQEAVEKHDPERGNLLSFAKVVIRSRLLNYLKIENRDHCDEVSLDELEERGKAVPDASPGNPENELAHEISLWKKELEQFNITFELLVEESPRHKDTRERAIDISEKSSSIVSITNFIYDRKRFPIKKVSLKLSVSEKILKHSKVFILSVTVLFFKNYRNLKIWIKG